MRVRAFILAPLCILGKDTRGPNESGVGVGVKVSVGVGVYVGVGAYVDVSVGEGVGVNVGVGVFVAVGVVLGVEDPMIDTLYISLI